MAIRPPPQEVCSRLFSEAKPPSADPNTRNRRRMSGQSWDRVMRGVFSVMWLPVACTVTLHVRRAVHVLQRCFVVM